MYIARILYPVRVLGPGSRIGIWFAGCAHRCHGCSNPELWERKKQFRVSLSSVMKLIEMIAAQNQVEGFTITGGDPFYQPTALKRLLKEIKPISQDILVYTGYTIEEVKRIDASILKDIAVLIDGPYIEGQNKGSILKGSDNQNIYICDPNYQHVYDQYLKNKKNMIQNFSTSDGIISVGIHHPGYSEDLKRKSREKGLDEKL